MPLEFWVGQDFDWTHERRALSIFLKDMISRYEKQSETVFVLSNFRLQGKQIDLTVLKRNAIIIVDFKDCSSPFETSENGIWKTTDTGQNIGIGSQNPYEQINGYRKIWMTYLNETKDRFLPKGKASGLDFTHVSAIVAISPILNSNYKNNIPLSIRWFSLVGLDHLSEEIHIRSSPKLDLSVFELRTLVKEVLDLHAGDLKTGSEFYRQSAKVIGDVPAVPPVFIGRDRDVKELKKRLGASITSKSNTTNTQLISAVHGWPGIGKTTIASSLANDYEVNQVYFDGILWTSLGEEPDIPMKLYNWCKDLNITSSLQELTDTEQIRIALINYLRNKVMLLIIDDVWQAEDAQYFRVGGRNCSYLFTTRSPAIAESISPLEQSIYKLTQLSEKDAEILLKSIIPDLLEFFPQECKILIKELEGLPLALIVAGKMLLSEKRRGADIKELFNEIFNGLKLLEANVPADLIDLAKHTTPTVAAILRKSTDRLCKEDKIRFTMLGGVAYKPAYLDFEDMMGLWGDKDKKISRNSLNNLLDYGLIEYKAEKYYMHSLFVKLALSLCGD